MRKRSTSLLSVAIGVSFLAAACGSDKKASSTEAPTTTAAAATTTAAAATTAPAAETTAPAAETTAPAAETTAPGGGAVSLKGDCPDTIVLQTDWMPEAEHGFI